MFYTVKTEVPDPFFFIDNGRGKYVFLDHREFNVFLEHCPKKDIEVVLLNPLFEEAAKLPDNTSLTNKLALLLFNRYALAGHKIEVPTSFPLDLADFLRSKGLDIVPVSPFYPERLKKTEKEAALIESALQKTCKAYDLIEQILRASTVDGEKIMYKGTALTSEFLKTEVEKLLLTHGLLNTEGIIISCGPHAAIPHHPGQGELKAGQTIICDLFPRDRKSGYFADMTRTYIKGNVSNELRDLYDAVKAAQTKALDMIKPGVKLTDVHQTCIDLFLARGFHHGDKGFIHGTGHGLGIDIHEPPYLNSGRAGVLEAGNIVTVEPGLYYPELGGVRIEDVVYVTESACRNLTNYRKDLIVL